MVFHKANVILGLGWQVVPLPAWWGVTLPPRDFLILHLHLLKNFHVSWSGKEKLSCLVTLTEGNSPCCLLAACSPTVAYVNTTMAKWLFLLANCKEISTIRLLNFKSVDADLYSLEKDYGLRMPHTLTSWPWLKLKNISSFCKMVPGKYGIRLPLSLYATPTLISSITSRISSLVKASLKKRGQKTHTLTWSCNQS